MQHQSRNVLLIVEGEKDEGRLVESLFNRFVRNAQWTIYPYGTVIHDLIEKIDNDYDGDFENIEIRNVLVDMLPTGNDSKRDMLLYTKFTDVILMFDFDPMDDRMNVASLRKMLNAFNDSSDTDKGLLLLNYPAIESVKEAAALPYEVFLKSYANADTLCSYKQKVNDTISKYPGKYANFSDYDTASLVKAIAHTVGKSQHILDGTPAEETFPYANASSLSDCCWNISLCKLLDYQINEFTTNGRVATCGTGPFFIAGWKKSLDGTWRAFFGD